MVAGERFRPQVSPFGIARRGEMILQKVAGGRAPFGGFAFHDLCLSFPAVGVDQRRPKRARARLPTRSRPRAAWWMPG